MAKINKISLSKVVGKGYNRFWHLFYMGDIKGKIPADEEKSTLQAMSELNAVVLDE